MYRKPSMLYIIVAAVFILSACAGADGTEPTDSIVVATSSSSGEVSSGSKMSLPDIDPASVSGEILSAGSSTVYPLAEVMADRFRSEGFAGTITIDSIGSGAGFERFCVAGETDIANASRPIKDSEVESCQSIGRTPIEFRVGTDALAVVVSSENDFLTEITLQELGRIFSDEVVRWSEVRAEWPDEDILRFSPGTDSGTFDFFVEAVMGPLHADADGKADLEAGETSILNAANIQFSEDDNVLVQGVEGSPYSIGYFGYAYYTENQGKLKTISIDGVSPNEDTAESGEYPLARPLFIYSDAGVMEAKPQVAAFINFFLSYVDEEILAVGYFPTSPEALETSMQSWIDAVGQ